MPKIVAVLLPLLLAAPAFADEAPPASDNFALVPATGQYLRIDRRSGEVSLCAERDATWQCQLLADDRAALEGRLTDLEREVARLKAENAALKASAAPARSPWACRTSPIFSWLTARSRCHSVLAGSWAARVSRRARERR